MDHEAHMGSQHANANLSFYTNNQHKSSMPSMHQKAFNC